MVKIYNNSRGILPYGKLIWRLFAKRAFFMTQLNILISLSRNVNVRIPTLKYATLSVRIGLFKKKNDSKET